MDSFRTPGDIGNEAKRGINSTWLEGTSRSVKVLGGAMSPINDDWVRIGLGLSVVYDKQLGEQNFQEKPSAKEPASLSMLTRATIYGYFLSEVTNPYRLLA